LAEGILHLLHKEPEEDRPVNLSVRHPELESLSTGKPFAFLDDFLARCDRNGGLDLVFLDIVLHGLNEEITSRYETQVAMNYLAMYTAKGDSDLLTTGLKFAGVAYFSRANYERGDFSRAVPFLINDGDSLTDLIVLGSDAVTYAVQNGNFSEGRTYLSSGFGDKRKRVEASPPITKEVAAQLPRVAAEQSHLTHNLKITI
tara:strand:- start:1224 stop:1826 length:603 start_codon:yes stop_codon:yes gene_type:complete